MINTQIPPHSVEAEQAILGGIILNNDVWQDVSNVLNKEDFYNKNHIIIYTVIQNLFTEDKLVDIITISKILDDEKKLEKIGGISYLNNLTKNNSNINNIQAYLSIIKERSALRAIMLIGNEIIGLSLLPKKKNINEILNYIENKILSISNNINFNKNKTTNKISDVLTSTLRRIETLFELNNPITGLSSGFSELDKITSGLQESDLIIIAGRPSMGKTTFSTNIAEYITIKTNKPVIIFSIEMSSEQLVTRILSSLSGIELQRLKTGMLKDTDWPKLSYAISLISSKNLYIDDSGILNLADIKFKSKFIEKKHGKLGIIVIDYLQLMNTSKSSEYRTAEISEISRLLKLMAKELKVPIIVLSQLNRSLEQRQDKRPIMSDLRESGSIEQDADLILFVYRDEIYNKNTIEPGIAEIIIAKQRNGPTGTIKLKFFGNYSRFDHITNEFKNENIKYI